MAYRPKSHVNPYFQNGSPIWDGLYPSGEQRSVSPRQMREAVRARSSPRRRDESPSERAIQASLQSLRLDEMRRQQQACCGDESPSERAVKESVDSLSRSRERQFVMRSQHAIKRAYRTMQRSVSPRQATTAGRITLPLVTQAARVRHTLRLTGCVVMKTHGTIHRENTWNVVGGKGRGKCVMRTAHRTAV